MLRSRLAVSSVTSLPCHVSITSCTPLRRYILQVAHIHATSSQFARKPAGSSSSSKSSGHFTIAIPDPSAVSHHGVLDKLRMEIVKSKSAWSKDTNTVVILATPSYTSWCGDSHAEFLEKVLRRIFARRSSVKDEVFTTVTAVVDGLPQKSGKGITEGLAFLVGPGREIFSSWPVVKIFESEEPESLEGKEADLTFVRKSTADPDLAVEITVPLANTLFQNGQRSTLLFSRWIHEAETKEWKHILSAPQTSRRVTIPSSLSLPPLAITTPLVPLTPLYQVEAGLGNIVRQMRDRMGAVVPASTNLEKCVNDYFRRTRKQQQTVGVWALVIPARTYEAVDAGEKLPMRDGVIAAIWKNGATLKFQGYLDRWIKRGAKLCRVVSGGGGWGAKIGLLSLDPETSFRQTPQSESDFFQNLSFEDDAASNSGPVEALGNIAAPGSQIQFFLDTTSLNDDTAPVGFTPVIRKVFGDYTNDTHAPSMTFGVTRSTIDNQLYTPESGVTNKKDDKPARENMEFLPNHFGALTETALFVTTSDSSTMQQSDTPQVGTKISVPYARVEYREPPVPVLKKEEKPDPPETKESRDKPAAAIAESKRERARELERERLAALEKKRSQIQVPEKERSQIQKIGSRVRKVETEGTLVAVRLPKNKSKAGISRMKASNIAAAKARQPRSKRPRARGVPSRPRVVRLPVPVKKEVRKALVRKWKVTGDPRVPLQVVGQEKHQTAFAAASNTAMTAHGSSSSASGVVDADSRPDKLRGWSQHRTLRLAMIKRAKSEMTKKEKSGRSAALAVLGESIKWRKERAQQEGGSGVGNDGTVGRKESVAFRPRSHPQSPEDSFWP